MHCFFLPYIFLQCQDISAEFKWLWNVQSQGGIEDGEEPKSAAIRELREETGIVSAEIMAEVCGKKKCFLHYSFLFI